MLDWKIMAASFAALLVASTVLVGGVGGFGVTDVFNQLMDWLKSSPFGGFFQAPIASTNEVDITLFPKTYELKTTSDINLSIGSIELLQFNGDILADFEGKSLVFQESNTPLNIRMPLQSMTIQDISVSKIILENARFIVRSNELDTSGDNSTIEISDFSGEIRFNMDSVELHGNVSVVKGNGKEIV